MQSIPVYRFVVTNKSLNDPLSAGLLADAHSLGLDRIQTIVGSDLFYIQGFLSPDQIKTIAFTLLSDPVIQSVKWNDEETSEDKLKQDGYHVEVAYLPGVKDPVAEQIVRAAYEMGIPEVASAVTGQVYLINGDHLALSDIRNLAQSLLANPVIQYYEMGLLKPVFSPSLSSSGYVEELAVQAMPDEDLLNCSVQRRAALDLEEMRAIQKYFLAEGRPCTDAEFEMIAQTWSEHCVHKTFKGLVEVRPEGQNNYPTQVDGILNSYIRKATREIEAPWIISAFTDNAGIIEFDEDYEVSFKVETHNHPSAIEPFGGANTGVGGVIRDVLGVSAKPIAATDILCFGMPNTSFRDLPEGVYHPRRTFSGVVSGVQDYGNKIGIPTVNGAIWFDPAYTSNPLVYCGCVGIAPRGFHPRQPLAGDRVIVLGGKTGRDGLRGATFSSMTMDAQTGQVSGASVQIGDPITEKGVIEVTLRARDQRLYHAITDCGAGGLSSAIGEMASEIGADVDLARVPLKYPGLSPWEIWLSESQERMVLAVPPENLAQLQDLSDLFEVEMTDLGVFTGSGRMVVRYEGRVVVDLDNAFLHHGIPQRRLKADLKENTHTVDWMNEKPLYQEALLALLGHPNIASRESVIRVYDHEVQGATCIKPLTGIGAGPSDACVLKPNITASSTGIVLANGFNPEYGKLDPYRMALCVVDEAVRNAVAVGANPDRLAILDNFCWGDPLRPENMGSLLESARGCFDAAVVNRTPFISGKDSFNNEYLAKNGQRQSIPPSLLISSIGIIPDVNQCVTLDLKKAGNPIYLIGDFEPSFGGSHFNLCYGQPRNCSTEVPKPSKNTPAIYRAYYDAVAEGGLVCACHDLSEGGLAVAAAEMCLSSGLGLDIILPPAFDELSALFGETAGCLMVEVSANQEKEWLNKMDPFPHVRIGTVTSKPDLTFFHNQHLLFSLPVPEVSKAWRTPLF